MRHGYQVYHTIEAEREDLKVAGCWSHARRRFDEAVGALPKAKRKDSRAYLALTMIQAIYREEKLLKDLPSEERKTRRQLSVRPLVEAYFTWVKENIPKVPQKSKTWEGFSYSINQEKYLKVFLDDGEVPMDNNAAEQSIRGFCIGKKNWVMIDTVAGAKSSAVIYSIAETAKANNLKPYDYFEYLLTEIPKHLDDTNRAFLDEDSPLRKGAEEVMKNWAKNVVGELGEGVKITLSDFEPYRKLTADEAYLYTMGAKITFDSDGLILPFYGRAYFFRENDHIDVMMLLTPDEGKEPLVYAIDDLAKAAAKETDMQEEKEDLSVMLAKGAAGN